MKLTKDEISILFDLVFLGNWIVNSIRLEDAKIEKYERLAEKLEEMHKKSLKFEKMDCYLDMFDFYFSRLERFIDEYDDEGCLPKLAEKLAKAKYPNDLCLQIDARASFERELAEKGILAVEVQLRKN